MTSRHRISSRTGRRRSTPRRNKSGTNSLATADSIVDLTCTADETFIDLTSLTDSPVVIPDTPTEAPIQTRSQHRRSLHSSPLSERLGRDQVSYDDRETDGSEDLPPIPFSIALQSPAKKSADHEASASTTTSIITCPVCFDSLPQIKSNGGQLVSTTCGHIFCSQCISGIFANKTQARKCPTCRKPISNRTVHQLFI